MHKFIASFYLPSLPLSSFVGHLPFPPSRPLSFLIGPHPPSLALILPCWPSSSLVGPPLSGPHPPSLVLIFLFGTRLAPVLPWPHWPSLALSFPCSPLSLLSRWPSSSFIGPRPPPQSPHRLCHGDAAARQGSTSLSLS
jgi:hypothetical protein